MRLFEVDSNARSEFQQDLVTLLRDMQGQADSKRTTSLVTWADINNRLHGFSNIDQGLMDKIKTQIDPNDTLIQNITPEGIVLKTKVASPEQDAQMDASKGAPSIDAMASAEAKRSLTQ